MLSPKQQTFELIEKSKNILIVLPKDINADSLGSGLAFYMMTKNLGKKIDIVSQDPISEKLSFLPGTNEIKSEVTALRDFIISIDTDKNKIKQLRYEAGESLLKIFLSSQGKIEQKDIKLEPGPFIYDLVVMIGAQDLEALGQFYEKNTELFFEKPVLNIDHHSGNEYFGEVNLVEPTASSSAEILADFFNSFFSDRINPDIATCLLTGIIEATHSFQGTNTNPQTFSLASFLITQGAEKEKVIRFLYKTKAMGFLRLWGKLLGTLDWDAEKNLAWLEALTSDFEETKTTDKDLPDVCNEINEMIPQLNACIILYQAEPDMISVLIQSARPDLLQKINMELGGNIKNSRALLKIVSPTTTEAKNKLHGLIKSVL